jgi:hypothetical protein
MAAGAFVFPDKAVLNFFSATNLLGASTANFKLALVSSAWAPDDAADEVWADASAAEIAAGNGYSTGGGALSGVALTQTSGAVKFTANAFVWTATGGSIPPWRRGVVYYSGTLNGKVNPIVGHFLGDDTPADVPATTDGDTLTVTPHASGILSVEQVA